MIFYIACNILYFTWIGLPGLVAGVYAKEVCLSDFVTEVLDNLNDNVKRNRPNYHNSVVSLHDSPIIDKVT